MVPQYTIPEFEKKFCFNKYRQELFDLLIDELFSIDSQCKSYRILIFGSFLTRKKRPNDIDLLICIIPTSECVYKMMKSGLEKCHPEKIDIKYIRRQMVNKGADDLIKYFNDNPFNKKEDIHIEKAVELV